MDQIDSLKLKNENYIEIIEKLETDILFYRVKEDYYSVALGEQANRFALIVGGLLGLLALVSFGGFRYELNRIIKKTDERLNLQTKEFEDHKQNVLRLEKNLCNTSGNNFVTIAQDFRRNKKWVNALTYYLCASREHHKAAIITLDIDDTEKDEVFKYVIGNLNPAIFCLNKIKTDTTLKNEVDKKKERLKEDLNQIDNTDSEEVKDLVSEIRIGIKNYIK